MGHKIHLKQTPRELEIDLKKNLMYCTFLCLKDVWLFELYFNFGRLLKMFNTCIAL